MDALSFIASLVRSLTWPTAVVFILWYFNQPLGELLLTVSRFRFKEFEIDFGKEIREVKAAAEKVLPPTEGAKSRVLSMAPKGMDRFPELARIDPAAAVLVAWRPVELALRRAAQRHALALPMPPIRIMQTLPQWGRIDRQTYEIFEELRRLRNQAAHEDGTDITESEALEFGELALRLAAKIDEI